MRMPLTLAVMADERTVITANLLGLILMDWTGAEGKSRRRKISLRANVQFAESYLRAHRCDTTH